MGFVGRIVSVTSETVRRVTGRNSYVAVEKDVCREDEKPSPAEKDILNFPEQVQPPPPTSQTVPPPPTHCKGWKIKDIIKNNWKYLVVVVLLSATLSLVASTLLLNRGIAIMPIFIYPGFMISGCTFLFGSQNRGMPSDDTHTTVDCTQPSTVPPHDELVVKSESSFKVINVNITNNVQISGAPAPPPPPPPPSPSPSNGQLVVECRKLSWDVVGRDSLAKGTVWNKMSRTLSAEEIVDIDELSSMFGIRKSQITTKAIKVITAKQTILGTKKKLNISISLAHSKLSSDVVMEALLNGKADLSTDLLENLLKFAPSEMEECALRKQGKEDKSVFTDVEMFFYKIITKIPTYKGRIRTMLLKAQMQERISHIQPYLQTIVTASKEVRQSVVLNEFLIFVLAVGNFMNRSKTRGFKVSFLGKLIAMKSNVDKKTTFLDFVVKNFKASHPNMTNMAQEMTHVKAAAKINFRHLACEVDELSKELELLENDVQTIHKCKVLDKVFKKNIKEFETSIQKEFQSLVELKNIATTSLKETLEYFGEDQRTTMTNEQFFGDISTFLRHLEESLKKQNQ